MMANVQEIEINIHKDMIEYIKWLQTYKNIADEVLSILTTVNLTDNELQLVHAQSLALRALNLSAHEEPISGVGEI